MHNKTAKLFTIYLQLFFLLNKKRLNFLCVSKKNETNIECRK